MFRVNVILTNETGLHARPANLFVKRANHYQSKITILKEDSEYNGKSIISILSMAAAKGAQLTLVAEGDDENKAGAELLKLIQDNFGE